MESKAPDHSAPTLLLTQSADSITTMIWVVSSITYISDSKIQQRIWKNCHKLLIWAKLSTNRWLTSSNLKPRIWQQFWKCLKSATDGSGAAAQWLKTISPWTTKVKLWLRGQRALTHNLILIRHGRSSSDSQVSHRLRRSIRKVRGIQLNSLIMFKLLSVTHAWKWVLEVPWTWE